MWAIFVKELLELSRDKKTLNFTVFMPTVLLPALIIGLAYYLYTYTEARQEGALNYVWIGDAGPSELSEGLSTEHGFVRVAAANPDSTPAQLLRQEGVDLVLENESVGTGSPLRVKLHQGTRTSAFVEKRVRERLDAINGALRPQLLQPLGVSVAEVEPRWAAVTLEVVDARSKREEVGGDIARILPYLLLIVCLVGAMYPAIDIAAGEKERGTLQTLVVTPVARQDVVGGKFLVIFVSSLLAGVLSIVSMIIWTVLVGQAIGVGYLVSALATLGPASIAWIALLLIPLAATSAALMLSISVYARSFKEAQSYAMPLNVVVFLPAIIVLLPEVTLDWTWVLVPLANVPLAIKALLLGSVDVALLAANFVASAMVAGLLLLFCVYWFQREDVLFREAV
jgi:sodium transport system permease protein